MEGKVERCVLVGPRAVAGAGGRDRETEEAVGPTFDVQRDVEDRCLAKVVTATRRVILRGVCVVGMRWGTGGPVPCLVLFSRACDIEVCARTMKSCAMR